MKDRIFIDSNIFIYTLDNADKDKQKISQDFLKSMSENSTPVISTQVLNEVFAVATRKLKIDPLQTKSYIKSLFKLETIIVNQDIINSAIDYSILEKISYWDALMISCAETASCNKLATEDLSNGQKIKSVMIFNPFKS